MKKLLLLAISLVMVFSMAMFTGCNGEGSTGVANCDVIFYMAEVDNDGRELTTKSEGYYDDYSNFTKILTIKKGKTLGNVQTKVEKALKPIAAGMGKIATIRSWQVIENTWEVEDGADQVVLIRVNVSLANLGFN
jgi:hypothetical protein